MSRQDSRSQSRRFLPYIAGGITLVVFVGGIFGNLVANDLAQWIGGTYRALVWGIVVIGGVVATGYAVWAARREQDSTEDRESSAVVANRATLPPWIGRPPVDRSSFFGRRNDLAELDRAFQEHRAVVIYGGARYGKTRLAAEYTAYSGAHGFWSVAGDDPNPGQPGS